MVSVEDQKLQRQYYETVRQEFAREGPATSFLQWLCRALTFMTPFGIRVNYSRRDGSPYRLEVHLTPAWIPWGVNLHHFFCSDPEPEYHNHPWSVGYALILLNGYIEHYLEQDTRRRLSRVLLPWRWNILRDTNYARTWHRLELLTNGDSGIPLRPWTLFFHGRRFTDESDGVSSWGFLNVDTLRYTRWRQFVNQSPSRNEKIEPEIEVSVDPDPTPMFGTFLGAGVPDTFDTDDCPTTPIPSEISKAFSKENMKEARDASVCTGLPSEPEPGTRPTDQEGTP
jgi:hypothetical protein